QTEYKPGQDATVKLKLTDLEGRPFVGSTVMSVYDKSVEYISGGTNVPEIKEFFWKWRRQHHTSTESSLYRHEGNLLRQGEHGMTYLGVFGSTVIEEFENKLGDRGEAKFRRSENEMFRGGFGGVGGGPPMAAATAAPLEQAGAGRQLGLMDALAKSEAKEA